MYLTDLFDPWWRGVVERLKDDARTRPIPVLVCTAALHLTEEIQSRLSAWDCLVVTKPFDLDALLGEISRCLGEHEREPIPA